MDRTGPAIPGPLIETFMVFLRGASGAALRHIARRDAPRTAVDSKDPELVVRGRARRLSVGAQAGMQRALQALARVEEADLHHGVRDLADERGLPAGTSRLVVGVEHDPVARAELLPRIAQVDERLRLLHHRAVELDLEILARLSRDSLATFDELEEVLIDFGARQPSLTTDVVSQDVERDAQEPRAESGRIDEAPAVPRGSQQGLLDQVLDLALVAAVAREETTDDRPHP